MGNEIKATSKQLFGEELLYLIDNCIQLASDSRELAYRVHVTDNVKSAGEVSKKPEKITTFYTTAKDKLLILKSILEDSIESQREF